MTKEQCNCAAGPWYLSSKKKPPRDGRLIIGIWENGSYPGYPLVAHYSQRDWLPAGKKAKAWILNLELETHCYSDPDWWVEIRLPEGEK